MLRVVAKTKLEGLSQRHDMVRGIKDQDVLLTPEVCFSVGFFVVGVKLQLTSVQGSSPV